MMTVSANTEKGLFTLQDVETVLPLKSWWAMLAVLPLVRRLTLLTVNHTPITPNVITVASILLRLLAAWCYFEATRTSLVLGAVLFYFSYVLDCMDGAVARLKKRSSNFGRYLDHLGDLFGGTIAIAALAYGQDMLWTPLAAGLLFCHVAEYYISYLSSTILDLRKDQMVESSSFWSKGPVGAYVKYRRGFHERNMKSFFSFPDYEALVFLVFPLLGLPALGLTVGFVVVLVIILYTIFSTFVMLHSGGKVFP